MRHLPGTQLSVRTRVQPTGLDVCIPTCTERHANARATSDDARPCRARAPLCIARRSVPPQAPCLRHEQGASEPVSTGSHIRHRAQAGSESAKCRRFENSIVAQEATTAKHESADARRHLPRRASDRRIGGTCCSVGAIRTPSGRMGSDELVGGSTCALAVAMAAASTIASSPRPAAVAADAAALDVE